MLVSKWALRAAAALSLCVAGTAVAQEAQRCAALGQYGIYDYVLESNTTSQASSYRRQFCQQNFSSLQSARNFNLSLGVTVPLEGVPVPVDLGLDQSEHEFKSSYAQFCDDTAYDSSMRSTTERYVQTINPGMVALLGQCMQNKSGLRAWLTLSDEPDNFVFRASFSPESAGAVAPTINLQLQNATCQRTQAVVTVAGFSTFCQRTNRMSSASILVDSTTRVHEDTPLRIAAFQNPAPPPPPLPAIRLSDLPRSGGNMTTVSIITPANNSMARGGRAIANGIFMDPSGASTETAEYDFQGTRYAFFRAEAATQVADSCPSSVEGLVSLKIEGRRQDGGLTTLLAEFDIAGSSFHAIPRIDVRRYRALVFTVSHKNDRFCDSFALVEPILQPN